MTFCIRAVDTRSREAIQPSTLEYTTTISFGDINVYTSFHNIWHNSQWNTFVARSNYDIDNAPTIVEDNESHLSQCVTELELDDNYSDFEDELEHVFFFFSMFFLMKY